MSKPDKPKTFNQFDAFKTILSGPELSSNDQGKINSYLLLRWLSGDNRIIQAQNVINRYYDIPVEAQYKFFRNMLHGKVKFIKYPKGINSKTSDDVLLIQEHYKVSLEKAEEMFELISKEELKELKGIYRR